MLGNGALIVAALLLTFTGVAHSYLGERLIFPRLLALPDLPLLHKDRRYTENIFRYAWHLTSVAWWGFAALLIVLVASPDSKAALCAVLAATLLLHCGIILATAGTRHPAWWLFLLAGAATLYAAFS
jgi:hypothetical protein